MAVLARKTFCKWEKRNGSPTQSSVTVKRKVVMEPAACIEKYHGYGKLFGWFRWSVDSGMEPSGRDFHIWHRNRCRSNFPPDRSFHDTGIRSELEHLVIESHLWKRSSKGTWFQVSGKERKASWKSTFVVWKRLYETSLSYKTRNYDSGFCISNRIIQTF